MAEPRWRIIRRHRGAVGRTGMRGVARGGAGSSLRSRDCQAAPARPRRAARGAQGGGVRTPTPRRGNAPMSFAHGLPFRSHSETLHRTLKGTMPRAGCSTARWPARPPRQRSRHADAGASGRLGPPSKAARWLHDGRVRRRRAALAHRLRTDPRRAGGGARREVLVCGDSKGRQGRAAADSSARIEGAAGTATPAPRSRPASPSRSPRWQ